MCQKRIRTECRSVRHASGEVRGGFVILTQCAKQSETLWNRLWGTYEVPMRNQLSDRISPSRENLLDDHWPRALPVGVLIGRVHNAKDLLNYRVQISIARWYRVVPGDWIRGYNSRIRISMISFVFAIIAEKTHFKTRRNVPQKLVFRFRSARPNWIYLEISCFVHCYTCRYSASLRLPDLPIYPIHRKRARRVILVDTDRFLVNLITSRLRQVSIVGPF